MSFAKTLKELRKQKKLTQKELAEILGIDQTTVSKWELEKAYPDNQTLIKLSKFFGVSTDYLLKQLDLFDPKFAFSLFPPTSDDQLDNYATAESDNEEELLSIYRALPPEYQALALTTLRSWAGVPTAAGASKKKA